MGRRYIELSPAATKEAQGNAELEPSASMREPPDIDVKPLVLDLLPHKLPPPPSRLPPRNHTPLSPSHQPCLSQCSPILRCLWWEQSFLFLQDADLHVPALEIFWWFGVGVEEFSFLGRGGGTGEWLGGWKWSGRSGQDGGGEIGGEGGFAGGFGFGV